LPAGEQVQSFSKISRKNFAKSTIFVLKLCVAKVRRQVQNLMASVAVAKLVTWYGCVIRVLTSRATATDFEGYSRLIGLPVGEQG